MKIKEYGLICLWMSEHPHVESEAIGDFAHHFRNMVEDVSEEGYLTEETKSKFQEKEP